MDNLRLDIPMRFDFLFAATHAEVISGRQEGVYLWIAINHALGKFDHTLGGRNHSTCGLCYSLTNTSDDESRFNLVSLNGFTNVNNTVHVYTRMSSTFDGVIELVEEIIDKLINAKHNKEHGIGVFYIRKGFR